LLLPTLRGARCARSSGRGGGVGRRV